MHRVLLISLDWRRAKDPRTSLAHASILARLVQEADVEVETVATAVNDPAYDEGRFFEQVRTKAMRCQVVAVGAYVWNDAIVRRLLAALNEHGFAGRHVVGGPQVSYSPIGVAELYPEAHAFIRGYAEDALVRVLRADHGERLHGVVWQGEPDPGTQAQVDIEALPSPILGGFLPVQPFMRWETQRGCIYSCSFCQHREAGARLQRRTLAPGRIADEIEALVRGGARDIAVLDPIFNTNPDATAILRRFSELGYSGRLSLQSRFELLDDEFLDACQLLDVRLEFGLQTVQRPEMKAVRRMNNLPRVEQAIEQLHERAIPFEVSLIYGLPNQNLASFRDTVRWCQDRGVPVIRAFPLMLLRGTGLDRERERWGLVESANPIPVVVESDSFTRAEWEQMRLLADSLMDDDEQRGAA